MIKQSLRRFLPRTARPHTIRGGPLKGRYLSTSWHDYPMGILGQDEPGLMKWFAENVRRGETWLDIGAYYGYTSLALSLQVGEGGRVFAFEPLLSTAGHLMATKTANGLRQLQIVPLALGASAELMLLKSVETKGMAVEEERAPDRGAAFSVLSISLDSLWPRICGGLPQVDGVKIDVQGMETQVLSGMVGILREQQPKLVVEVHQGVDRNALVRTLESAGYDGSGRLIEPAPHPDKNYEFARRCGVTAPAECGAAVVRN